MSRVVFTPVKNARRGQDPFGWLPVLLSSSVRADGPGPPSWRESVGPTFVRLRLFLVSYAPLQVILAVRFSTATPRVVAGLLALAGFVDAAALLRGAEHRASTTLKATEVSDRGAEVAGYLATYLLPFVVVTTPTARDAIAYGIYFLVAAVVYVRSDMIHVNPTFYAVGRRVVSVTLADGREVDVICRRAPRPHEHLKVVRLFGVFIVRDRREGD